METISRQIEIALDMERTLSYVKSLPSQQKDMAKLNTQLLDRENEIKSCEKYKKSLYEDYRSGLISKEDYILFGKDYTEEIDTLKQATARLEEEIELLLGNDSNAAAYEWLHSFTQHRGVQSLTRQIIANLIERINIFTGKRVSITFRYSDKMKSAQDILDSLQKRGGDPVA